MTCNSFSFFNSITLVSLYINAYEMLFISSEVAQKCINSFLFFNVFLLSNLFFKKYSIDLTSWFVVFSIFLISTASFSVKFLIKLNRYCLSFLLKLNFFFIRGRLVRKINHVISTCSLFFIKPYSLLISFSSCSISDEYRPSTGDIDFKLKSLFIFVIS